MDDFSIVSFSPFRMLVFFPRKKIRAALPFFCAFGGNWFFVFPLSNGAGAHSAGLLSSVAATRGFPIEPTELHGRAATRNGLEVVENGFLLATMWNNLYMICQHDIYSYMYIYIIIAVIFQENTALCIIYYNIMATIDPLQINMGSVSVSQSRHFYSKSKRHETSLLLVYTGSKHTVYCLLHSTNKC